jgi:ABC-type lipoprotein export system ATPase subunit
MTMLHLDDVTKVYSSSKLEVKAITGVSLLVEPGEAVAIQGPSGCGKSTLLLVSGALLRPTGGTVRVAGTQPYELNANQRSTFRAHNIGFVFQQFHLVPYLNVLQNILTANVPRPQPDPRQRAGDLIEHFRLEHRIHHLPAELSVGEKQRVALARALFNKPRLVLADEPTGNLDPDNSVTVLDALREYAEDGGAVLMVTHDPNAAKRAHRIVAMDRGQLIPQTEYTSPATSDSHEYLEESKPAECP